MTTDRIMCLSKTCTVRDSCKRSTDKPNEFNQYWKDFSIILCNEDNNYEFKEDNSNVKPMWGRR